MWVCPECGEIGATAGTCPRDRAVLVDSGDDELIGHTIGSYRIARRLGAGGMGEVYLGVHPDIGSRVAIKVLARDCLAQRDLVDRFFYEAQVVNKIRHENIVNVLDLSRLPDGRPFIIMEYLAGAPLSAVIDQRAPLPLGSLARIMGEILDALGAAHLAGIVHRDLKPDNIFITPNGRAKVLDFGIAKLLPEFGELAGATRTGAILGTPHYMAPEQAASQTIDARTDIYAAGVILFEGATATRPFVADSLFELLRMHVDDPPPAPRSLRAEMPAAYAEVMLCALAKAPEQRFASAQAMAAALRDATASLAAPEWDSLSITGDQGHFTIAPSGAASPVLTATPSPFAPTIAGNQNPATASAAPGSTADPGADATIPEVRRRGLPWATIAIAAIAATLGAALIAVLMQSDASSPPSAATSPGDASSPPTAPPAPAGVTGDASAVAPTPAAVPPATPTHHRPRPTRASRATPPPAAKSPPVDAAPTPTATAPLPAKPATAAPFTVAVDFDPRRFDARAYLPRAQLLARRLFSDAVLVEFDVSGVMANGLANLAMTRDIDANFWFRSPSRSKRPADIPRGVEIDITCMVYVEVNSSIVKIYPATREICNQPRRPRPRCSIGQVWKRAIELHAPADHAAKITYLDDGWFFTIGDDTFTESIPDDC